MSNSSSTQTTTIEASTNMLIVSSIGLGVFFIKALITCCVKMRSSKLRVCGIDCFEIEVKKDTETNTISTTQVADIAGVTRDNIVTAIDHSRINAETTLRSKYRAEISSSSTGDVSAGDVPIAGVDYVASDDDDSDSTLEEPSTTSESEKRKRLRRKRRARRLSQ